MCAAMLSLASCNSDDNVERRLTTNQKERYSQNISGEYSGEYIIIYKDKDCTDMTDEKGRHIITKAHEATFSDVQLASPQAITARYGFDYDTDYSHIKWAFIPNVMLLNLNYGGADHHIRMEFNNNSQYYTFTEDEMKQPKAFGSLAKNVITLQLEAIHDGSTLIQRFGYENGNYMHIIFKASPL